MPRKARPQPRRIHGLALLALLAAGAGVLFFGLRGRGGPEGLDALAADAGVERRWMPAKKSQRWTCIVIHHSASEAGGADRFGDWHKERGWDELGYHFVVGNGTDTADGQIEVGPRWVAQKHGAHCKTPDDYFNQHGIGVCLVGNFDLHPPAASQMKSLRRLIRFLSREFRIPPERIYTHGGVTRQTKCPGKHFDVQALRRSLAKG